MSNEQNLEKALEYAVNIIEAYQLEIRYATSGNPESPYKIRRASARERYSPRHSMTSNA
jgi:electron transfer flavoprotein alpha/beta subunit